MNSTEQVKRCSECGKMELYPAVISHNTNIRYEGAPRAVSIPELHVWKCRECGDVLFDDISGEEISQALRDLLGLLSPQEIRKRLDRLGLNQKEFCEQIRIAPESLTRWLGGEYIQSRAYDELMRLFFEKAMTQHRIPKPNAVVVTEGTLFPWHCPVPYQYVPWSKTLLDSDVVPGSSGDLALAA